MSLLPLWAVHISDGILSEPWWLAGFAVSAVLLYWSGRRVREDEIPRIAILTAGFFISSLIHIRVGPTSAHLLFNALVGIVLGRRAVLAIAVGLFLQALLLQHGGLTALGVNCCVIAVPALAARGAFVILQRFSLGSMGRSVLVALAVFLWLSTLTYSIALLVFNPPWADDSSPWLQHANHVIVNPVVLLSIGIVSCLTGFFESRLQRSQEFASGLLIGEATVLLTVALNCAALVLGGVENMTFGALLAVLLHLPIAFIEGAVLGFTVAFVARVKPDMLALPAPHAGDLEDGDKLATCPPTAETVIH